MHHKNEVAKLIHELKWNQNLDYDEVCEKIHELMSQYAELKQREILESLKESHKAMCAILGVNPDKIDENHDHYEKLITA